jgi:hypothetical protein
MSDLTFAQARDLAVAALRDSYAAKFPERELVARRSGRDLGDSWAVFVALASEGGGEEQLIGAPVIAVHKADGRLSLRQIPPDFDILDAPAVHDEAD